MAKNVRANIELGVQIVIALAVVVVAGAVVKRNFFQGQDNSGASPPHITAGSRLTVPNVDWKQNQKSLVFFLKKDCIYCKYGAPFYRELIKSASQQDVKVLAILPDSIVDGKQYLQSLELPIEDVQSASLTAFQVTSTPTILFVDSQGIVKSVWVGSAPTQEKGMRDELLALFAAKT